MQYYCYFKQDNKLSMLARQPLKVKADKLIEKILDINQTELQAIRQSQAVYWQDGSLVKIPYPENYIEKEKHKRQKLVELKKNINQSSINNEIKSKLLELLSINLM